MDGKQLEDDIKNYRSMMYRIAYNSVGNFHDSEDIVQETFIRLYMQKNPFESEEAKKAWLIRVVINLCKNRNMLKWNRCRDEFNEFSDNAVFSDGGVFDCAPYTVTDENEKEIIGENGNSITEIPVFDFVSAENKVTFTEADHVYSKPVPMRIYSVKSESEPSANAVIAVCLEDTEGTHLRLDLSGLYLKKCHGTKAGGKIIYRSHKTFEAAGSFSCEIDLDDCNTPCRRVLNAGKVNLPVYSGGSSGNFSEYNVEELTVSCTSLSVKLSCTAPAGTDCAQLDGFGTLVMKDGKEIAVGDYLLPSIVKEISGQKIISVTEQTPFRVIETAFILPETIDIDNADYVLIGDRKVCIG